MKGEHIIDILESDALANLSERELARVRAHAAKCSECRRAFDAARVASLLIKERAAESHFAPSPFFQTRVLAALRERRASEDAPAWRRLWRATGALVYSMAAVVVMLTGLTLVAPQSTTEISDASEPFSTEAVLLEQAELSEDDANFDDVFSTVYEAGDAESENGQDR